MSYHRILSRLYNVPLAISQEKLDVITSKVVIPILYGSSVVSDASVRPQRDANGNLQDGIINVFDSLVSKNGTGDSGSTSYESITNQVQSYISAGAKDLYFYFDSPGGEVAGLFGLAEYLNSLPSKYGVNTIGFTDGMATSAAYVLASSMQKLYATSSSILGSIGVIMTKINMAEKDAKDGITYQILRSKEEKALGSAHEPISDKATEDALALLSSLDKIMNESVNKFRPSVSIEIIKNLKGNTVLAEEALSLGLIDGVVNSVQDILSSERNSRKTLTATSGVTMQTEQELLAEIASLKAEVQNAKKEATKAEQDRILGILESSAKFSIPSAVALKRITANSSVEDAVSIFEAIAEATQLKAENVIPPVSQGSTVSKETKFDVPGQSDAITDLLKGITFLNEQMGV